VFNIKLKFIPCIYHGRLGNN